jgi:hypothetical protein
MRQKDETKQAEIMRALYSMRNTGHFPSLEVEEESLWQEVTQLLRTSVLFSESPLTKARILIFQDWEKLSLSYRMGGDDKTLKRQFALEYNPNRISTLRNRAERNGYRTKYSPPDTTYEAGLLEIELELT